LINQCQIAIGGPSFGNVLWQLALVELEERDTRDYSTINNTGFCK
jgi:hypothetical protein